MNAVSPWCDPVVAEVHAIREDLACEYEGDLLAYSDVAVAYGSRLNLHPASIVEVKTADVKAQAETARLTCSRLPSRSAAPHPPSPARLVGAAWRASPPAAKCACLQVRRDLGRKRPPAAGLHAFFDQLTQTFLRLLFLIVANQVAQVFAGVAVLARAHTLVDVRPQRIRQGKTHGGGAHGPDGV